MRRAELAVDKQDDALARAAVERSMSYKATAESFRQQVEDQKTQVENLKSALLKLQQKLAEAEAKSDMLIAQHRRSRALGKATEAGLTMGDDSNAAAFDRMKNKVQHTEATAQAHGRTAGRRRGGPVRRAGEAAGNRPAAERDQVQAESGLKRGRPRP